ncbi:hypothetical protein TNCV_2330761 [Trichonephila clavipes]|nr:hypothetical protein TNCV_2330761 [Trichonephila clavipes]
MRLYPVCLELSYQWLKKADVTCLMLCLVCFGSCFQIPVLIQRCNSGEGSDVTSTHVTIILVSFLKTEDDSLGDYKFLGHFQLGTATLQLADNSIT